MSPFAWFPHSFCELHFLLGATGVEWPSTASDVVLRCGVCWVLLRDQGNTACCFQGSKCFNWTPFSWMEWYSYVRFYCNYIEGVHGICPFSPFNSKMSNCRVWSIQTMSILMAGYWMILDHWSWSIINMKLITHKSPQTVWNFIESWIHDDPWNIFGSCLGCGFGSVIQPCRRPSKRCWKCHGDRIMAVS